MTLPGLSAKHQRDYTEVIHATGQVVTVLETAGPRDIRARVKMLSAEELANCMEQYSCRLHVSKADFPADPPRKGLIIIINGVRRGVLAVRLAQPNDIAFGWVMEAK
jgi:hypothetical protein